MTDAELDEWLEGRGPVIAEMARRLRPDKCVRMTTNEGHYVIVAYGEKNRTLQLAHGRDSYLPGVVAFGIPETEVVTCACGKWERPTDAQIKATADDIEAMRKQMLRN